MVLSCLLHDSFQAATVLLHALVKLDLFHFGPRIYFDAFAIEGMVVFRCVISDHELAISDANVLLDTHFERARAFGARTPELRSFDIQN